VLEHVLYIPAGLVVGALVGLTGVGGGALMTPILVMLFGQSPAVAVGTDLVFAATTKLAATASFGYSRKVDWRIVGRLAAGSLPAAAAVLAFLLWRRGSSDTTDHLVARSLSVTLIVTAIGLFASTSLRRWGLKATAAWLKAVDRWTLCITIAMGVLIGVAVTLTSVGAGALGVVGLLYLYPLRLTADRLVATDIAHALPLALLAGLGHATLGHLDLTVLAFLLLGSIPGVLIASRLAIRLPQATVRRAIAIVLGGTGVRLLLA